jgi:tRNA threonylcarbamoyladenosine biosynthesis protein TsaE
MYENGRIPLYHFDLYRFDESLTNRNKLTEFDEYIYGDGVCVIEWADICQNEMPKNAVWVDITIENDDTCNRIIRIGGKLCGADK